MYGRRRVAMYSATFALTIIIGIAATHLFLGFATAVLMGCGPRKFSDINVKIVPRPVSPRRSPGTPAAHPAREAAERDNSPQSRPVESAPPPAEKDGKPKTAQVPDKIVLSSKRKNKRDDGPPEGVLEEQLQSWREGELKDEPPSLSGVRFELEETQLAPETYQALSEAVYKQIRRQVRRDRRLLKLAPNQFAWFSADVSPEDALMPAERIRQTLDKTQFQHQGQSINLNVVVGIVAGVPDDTGDGLLQRLSSSLQYVLEKPDQTTCLDTGEGPREVAPHPVEVPESECEL